MLDMIQNIQKLEYIEIFQPRLQLRLSNVLINIVSAGDNISSSYVDQPLIFSCWAILGEKINLIEQ